MRLVDADELMEHVWRDKLDSREAIANMINNAPTFKRETTCYGYDVEEIHQFATMCRSAGIAKDELHGFIQDVTIIVKIVQDEMRKSMREAFKKAMDISI